MLKRPADLARLWKNQQRMNAKISRQVKKNPEMAKILPARVTKKEVKQQFENISSRKEFNREMRRVDNFMKRDATKIKETKGGAVTTKWELHEMRIDFRNAERLKREEHKRVKEQYPELTKDKAEPIERAFNPDQYKDDDFAKFRDNFRRMATEKDIRDQKQAYRENFRNHLIEISNSHAEAKRLLELSDMLTDDELILSARNNPTLEISYRYDPIVKHMTPAIEAQQEERKRVRLMEMVRDMEKYVEDVTGKEIEKTVDENFVGFEDDTEFMEFWNFER